jgi:hypothetical protein
VEQQLRELGIDPGRLSIHPPKAPHPTRHVHVGDQSADIDQDIATLIEQIWQAGIRTAMSCQDVQGAVWVEFETAGDLAAFLNAAGMYERGEGTLHSRIDGRVPGPGEPSETPWKYKVLVFDRALHGAEEVGPEGQPGLVWHAGPPDFAVLPSVYFPRSDLPAVLERMRRHNEAIMDEGDEAGEDETGLAILATNPGGENVVKIYYASNETGPAQYLGHRLARITASPLFHPLLCRNAIVQLDRRPEFGDDFPAIQKVIHSPYPSRMAVRFKEHKDGDYLTGLFRFLGCDADVVIPPSKKGAGVMMVSCPEHIHPQDLATALGIPQPQDEEEPVSGGGDAEDDNG